MEITEEHLKKIDALGQRIYGLMKNANGDKNPPLDVINNVAEYLHNQIIDKYYTELIDTLRETAEPGDVLNIEKGPNTTISQELYHLMETANGGKMPSLEEIKAITEYVKDLVVNQYYAELTVNLMGAAEPGDFLNIKRGPVTYRTQG